METASVSVYAKINLSLLITGSGGGYHALDMVVASAKAISDTVTVSRRGDTAVVFESSVPLPPQNAAIRAARAFQAAYGTPGADIRVTLGIPSEAGLGGSSADAAGVLLAMQRLFGEKPKKEIAALALSVGSDVPYMLQGGFARVTGRGEGVRGFEAPPLHLAVFKPRGGVSTAAAFAAYDAKRLPSRGDNAALVAALREGRPWEGGEYFVNDLFEAAASLNPEILPLYGRVRGTSPYAAVLSGSGSALAAFYRTSAQAEAAVKNLADCADFAVATYTI